MSERSGPKVMFLGMGKNDDHLEFQEMLQSLETFRVPPDFLAGIYITDLDDKRYKINKKLITNSVGYDNLDTEMRRLGVKPDIKLIEIVIDFDRAKSQIATQSSTLLDALFNDK